MGDRWPTQQVLALAPDASSAAAGRKLGSPVPWSDTGATDRVVWGSCAGSGKKPYQAVVELSGPAYTCSCPSRKFPCKHVLGLLLLWSEGGVPDAGEPADHAAAWLAGRAARAAATPSAAAAPKDPKRAAKNAAQRAERVTTGLDELRMWLGDQVGHGLAGLEADAYARFDAVAARLVDAQVPGMANRVRRLPAVLYAPDDATDSRADWPSRLLQEFGALWSLAAAHDRLPDLPDEFAATVRRHIGYPVAKADVLARPAVVDDWLVLGRRDTEEDHLQARRTWLRGAHTGRFGLILDYAPAGGTLPARPPVGRVGHAALHFYPGAPGHRCLPADTDPAPAPDTPESAAQDAEIAEPATPEITGTDLATARRVRAAAVAGDPWMSGFPVIITGRLGTTADGLPALIDRTGDAVGLRDGEGLWPLLLAVTEGDEVQVFGELGARGLDPLTVHRAGVVTGL
ncbi:SWIM zinc finger family protein [Gordonia sp. NB41Y]|uniref:SWIM zinc finger family protein n=1 Tax=Gordonia sp. NB41Y TaxID=875808 RepID=UPI00273CF455|nr:SWIM zinc finger family protein [Gordonia sp. NB41Y]WLP88777.1 SWIM zinc finger family protein [Gordonia sp. NB41Y]